MTGAAEGPTAVIRSAGIRLAFAGGGTGGHVVPGIAICEQAAVQGRLAGVLWLGSGRPAEARALSALERARRTAPARVVTLPLERGGAQSKVATLARMPRAVLAARRALVDAGSDIVVGLGGFASAAAVVAARTLRIPVVLLEVNATTGLATRVLAPLAHTVLHAGAASLPPSVRGRGDDRSADVRSAHPRLPSDRHAVAGPFLARALFAPIADDARRAEACGALGFDAARPLVVVLGGSQGAGALNRFVCAHAEKLVASGSSVLHQVGPGRMGEAAKGLSHYRAVEYVDDVPLALDAATLALARAGASTLAEVIARRVPAVVVPYPHAAKDHQRSNALALGDAVITVDEARLDEALAERLAALSSVTGAAERDRLRRRMAALAPANGAAVALRAIESILAARRRTAVRADAWTADLARETR